MPNLFDTQAAPNLPPGLPDDPHRRKLFLADVLWDAFDDAATVLPFGRWIEQQAAGGAHRETAAEYLRLRDRRTEI
jgi:hypothetical protein